MTHKFTHNTDNAHFIRMERSDDDITWAELTEFYFNYLQACGFVLTREQFAEEVNLMYRPRHTENIDEEPHQDH